MLLPWPLSRAPIQSPILNTDLHTAVPVTSLLKLFAHLCETQQRPLLVIYACVCYSQKTDVMGHQRFNLSSSQVLYQALTNEDAGPAYNNILISSPECKSRRQKLETYFLWLDLPLFLCVQRPNDPRVKVWGKSLVPCSLCIQRAQATLGHLSNSQLFLLPFSLSFP